MLQHDLPAAPRNTHHPCAPPWPPHLGEPSSAPSDPGRSNTGSMHVVLARWPERFFANTLLGV
ncbi:hypothetical protein HETIRDRAFT_450232 [Heterobasidion irregulare TC 32-1]|uniref:Uncharacterized protein n=1 Tax=Heterobasidion irregulare (strain TC 32-1) TaxID=747525 RepID=W4KHW8_HETIT|nr:uncharacterized protein HETIRDRAFT_450232 [Heterobasidion irregulare TC 32-1]ETW84910.1 hypothetical protein HETIRDRAFT_450232 [Heterobasidion irregulare TC 32-1]